MKKYDEAMIDFVEGLAKDQGVVIEGAVIAWHQMGNLYKVKSIDLRTRGPVLEAADKAEKPAKA